jgi:TolA-binding protein
MAYSAAARDVAAELFKQAAEATSSPELAANALAGQAWAQLRQEDFLGSAETFERLLEKYPDDPRASDAGLLRAQILERREDYDAALAAYERVIDDLAIGDALPKALFLAARLHDRLRQSLEAKELYVRLVNDFPESPHRPEALYHLGWLLREAGDQPAAALRWQSIHDLGRSTPHWHEATYLLAEDAFERGDLDRTRELVPELIDDVELGADPRDGLPADSEKHAHGKDQEVVARSLLLAAQLAMHDHDWELAREYVARIARDDPAGPLSLLAAFWVAEADYRLNRFDEAREEFGRLQAAAAGRDESWAPFVPLRLAQILAHQKQWAEAMAQAKILIEHHADFPLKYEAEYVLGRCHAAIGEFAAARDAYSNVINSDAGGRTETAAMAQWMIGESYLHQRDYDAALRAYLRGEILYAYPEWQARSLLQAGKCYELLEAWGKADAIYRRLVERFPDSAASEDARSRLSVVTGHVADRRN